MGSFSGTCEIVEAREDLNTEKDTGIYQSNSGYSLDEKFQKHPVQKLGYKGNLDDDINKLFESITLKSSSRDLGFIHGTSPKMKSALKKPIAVGASRSPRVGPSEPVTLKQALRDLCISKASEMASMKRLSKSTASPRISEVGKIHTLYNSVVVEGRRSEPSNVESKGSTSEISLVPEESNSLSLDNAYQSRSTVKSTSLSPNVQSSKIAVAIAITQNDTGASLMPSDLASSSSKVGVLSPSSEPAQIEKQTSESSSSSCNTNGSKLELPENASSPKKIGNKASASKNGRKGRLQTVSSSSTSVNGNRVCKLSRNAPRTVKSIIKNKNFGKKKVKQDSVSALFDPTCSEVNDKSVSGTTQLVCERCWCAIENNKGITSLDSISPGEGINSVNNSGAASAGCNSSREVTKVKKNTVLKEQLEFSQSSKSSQEMTPQSQGKGVKYVECNAAGELVEFELF
ncbi:Serine/threonine-protein kinase KIPK2 [Glycine max]|nr:Serine/threonine-protein kinase KIPK2 [Glycine max]